MNYYMSLKHLHHRNQPCCAGPAAALAGPQQFPKLIRRLHRHDWVVYAKPTFGGPMQALRYWAATPIVWPSLIIACWSSSKSASSFAGRITPTVASKAR